MDKQMVALERYYSEKVIDSKYKAVPRVGCQHLKDYLRHPPSESGGVGTETGSLVKEEESKFVKIVK